MAPRSQRRALGALFVVLAASFAGVAYGAGDARQWVIAVAAGVLALWMAGLAARTLRRR